MHTNTKFQIETAKQVLNALYEVDRLEGLVKHKDEVIDMYFKRINELEKILDDNNIEYPPIF